MEYLLLSSIPILALFHFLSILLMYSAASCLRAISMCGGECELRIINSGRRPLRIVAIGLVMADGRLGRPNQGLAAKVKLRVRPNSEHVFVPEFDLAIRFYYRSQERQVSGWYVQLAHGAVITTFGCNVGVIWRLRGIWSRIPGFNWIRRHRAGNSVE